MQTDLREIQQHFGKAMLEGGDGALTPLLRGDENTAVRIAVHRNTVRASLVEVLAAAYPVTLRIVGAAFFAQMAGQFVVAAPPRVPQLSAYGRGFADFIAAADVGQRLPYLADVARLGWARAEAYFAGDADVLDPAALAALSPADMAGLVLELHPATRVVVSAFPIHRIWSVNQLKDVPRITMDGAEAVLISRTENTLRMRVVAAADVAFISAVGEGQALGAAADRALGVNADFDLQAALAVHFSGGTFRASP